MRPGPVPCLLFLLFGLLFFFCPSPAFSVLSGWQLPGRSVGAVAATAAQRPGRRVASSRPPSRSSRAQTASSSGEGRPGAAGRRRRRATGRATAAGPAECRGRRHGRRRRRRPSTVARSSSSSSVQHRDDSDRPAGGARARETASQRSGPTSTRQPPASPCVGRAGARDARSPVLGSPSSSPSPPPLLPAADTDGRRGRHRRRHQRRRRRHHHQEPADGRRSQARAAQPAASCFGPAAETGSETGGPPGQRRRAAAARRRDAGARRGDGRRQQAAASRARRRCATKRRPSVAGARARPPRTPWSAAGSGTPNRGHVSRGTGQPARAPALAQASSAESARADSTSSELCLSDGASGGTGPPPVARWTRNQSKVQKRRAACAAPLLKRPGTRRAERRCDPARTPCSTLRTNR